MSESRAQPPRRGTPRQARRGRRRPADSACRGRVDAETAASPGSRSRRSSSASSSPRPSSGRDPRVGVRDGARHCPARPAQISGGSRNDWRISGQFAWSREAETLRAAGLPRAAIRSAPSQSRCHGRRPGPAGPGRCRRRGVRRRGSTSRTDARSSQLAEPSRSGVRLRGSPPAAGTR